MQNKRLLIDSWFDYHKPKHQHCDIAVDQDKRIWQMGQFKEKETQKYHKKIEPVE